MMKVLAFFDEEGELDQETRITRSATKVTMKDVKNETHDEGGSRRVFTALRNN